MLDLVRSKLTQSHNPTVLIFPQVVKIVACNLPIVGTAVIPKIFLYRRGIYIVSHQLTLDFQDNGLFLTVAKE